MTGTAHAVIGTVIAAKIGNPALAIPLALASHVVADMIPHWDTVTNRNQKSRQRLFIDTGFDGVLALTLSYSIIVLFFPSTSYSYAILIMFFAILPDILHAPYTFFGVRQFKWAYDFGHLTNKTLDKPWGIITQISAVSLLVFLALLF
jgi:hypothetical protein